MAIATESNTKPYTLDVASNGLSSRETIGAHSDLLNLLLNRQQQLTAIEQFSDSHVVHDRPEQEQYYRKLLPATPLEENEQFAFQVDLDRCSGCKACVTACHSLNGLDEEETWRDVGLVYSESDDFMQHVTSACHHCLEPACLIGCPTNSYEKDSVTGIVRHLDDQCFGCQYCTLACPYGVPKYHEKKGIVRKCDMCSQRLAVGEAPACAQACPHEAISITKVDIDEVRDLAANEEFLSVAHKPSYTQPTTVYKNATKIPEDGKRGDHYELKPEHAHLPLVIMLVLTQVATGMFLFDLLAATFVTSYQSTMQPFVVLAAFLIGQAALGASTMHLGRPHLAFRGILGIGHSWLSREIAAFGAFATFSGMAMASAWLPASLFPFPEWMIWPAEAMAVLSGIAGIYCSARIYIFTQRELWSTDITLPRFFMTALNAGPIGVLAIASVPQLLPDLFPSSFELSWEFVFPIALIGAVASFTKLVTELALFENLSSNEWTPMKKSCLMMAGPLKGPLLLRVICGITGGIAIPIGVSLLYSQLAPAVLAVSISAAFALVVLGELAERFLFFSAVVAPKMPRGVQL